MKLVEYDWADGMAHVTYEDENTGEVEYLTLVQPASSKHWVGTRRRCFVNDRERR